MYCRLCLKETEELLSLSDETTECKTTTEALELIAKYLSINLNAKDELASEKICYECLQQLFNFHKFHLFIDHQQQILQQRIQTLLEEKQQQEEENHEILFNVDNKYDDEIDDTDMGVYSPLSDIKDITLFEPQIDPIEPEINIVNTDTVDEINEVNNLETNELKVEIENVEKKIEKATKELKTKRKYIKKKLKTTTTSTILGKRSSLRPRKNTKNIPNKQQLNEPEDAAKVENKINYQKRADLSKEMDLYLAENAKLSCCLCEEPLKDFNMLKSHFRKVHKCIGYMLCCKNRFRKRTQYVDHLKWHENPEIFKCGICGKMLSSRGCYYNHMMTMHPTEDALKFQCEFCSRKFAKQYILDLHIVVHKRPTAREFICDICKKDFRTATELKCHQRRSHFNEFAIMCDICGKSFKTKQNFKEHRSTMHEESNEPEIQCTECKRWLKNKRSLYKHMYKHRDENSDRVYPCDQCDFVAKSRTKLCGHKSYYHPTKFYQCSMCEKSFRNPRTLEEHVATHTGKALYSCDQCGQTFKSHANKHNHIKKRHPNTWIPRHSQPSKPQTIATSVSNDEKTES